VLENRLPKIMYGAAREEVEDGEIAHSETSHLAPFIYFYYYYHYIN